MSNIKVSNEDISAIVDIVLEEDIGQGDLTTRIAIPSSSRLKAVIVARENLVVAGLPVVEEIFNRLEPKALLVIEKPDSSEVWDGEILVRVEGVSEGILTAERCALNALQFLSGIATLTRTYVKKIDGTKAKVLDTRKTVPGLRNLSKYAVRCGGGKNHRIRLDDGVLIKDNHIHVIGGIYEAIRSAKVEKISLPIQAECDTLEQVKDALRAGADSLLLDNMSLPILRQAVSIVEGRIPIEASGGITLKNIKAVAVTGVDYISVGAITQRAPAVDIGLDVIQI